MPCRNLKKLLIKIFDFIFKEKTKALPKVVIKNVNKVPNNGYNNVS